jgi:hypothetical protein
MKTLLIGITLLAFGAQLAAAQSSGDDSPTHEDVSEVKEFLFVQNASSGSFKDGRLTLDGAGPILFFSDRPYRIFGHTRPEHFGDAWDSGTDSFADDPPNAVLSILSEDLQSFGMVLSNPSYNNGTISYAVTVEDGTVPPKFGHASLFIDNEGWAAVGGLIVGRNMARRRQAEQAYAYQAGQSSTIAVQDQNSYYQAEAAAPVASSATSEQQLEQLKSMLDKGLISQNDYDEGKQRILRDM